MAVLRGDFPRAFYFHPLWPLPPLALALWMLRERIPRVLYRGLLGLMIAAFLLVWIARFFIPGQDIVVFAPWNGLADNAPRYGLHFQENGTTLLLWMLIGSLLCFIGSYVGIYFLLNNVNAICSAYNQQR